MRPAGVLAALLAALLVLLLGCAVGSAPDGRRSTTALPTTVLPTTAPPTTADAGGPAGRAVPVSVRIEAVDVARDDLLPLGVAPDGTAEVPEDYDRVGWFDRGPAPSAGGPTVLLGHVDSRRGPAVFYRLRDLRPGDVVVLGRSDGSQARYAVRRTEQVAKDRFPTFAVFGATRDDVLRLVTCAGAFDRGARSYTDNLVVHADRV